MEEARKAPENVKYCVGLKRELFHKVIDDVLDSYAGENEVAMFIVNLNEVVGESKSGRNWKIADTHGFRELNEVDGPLIRTRQERFNLCMTLKKRGATSVTKRRTDLG